MRRRMKRSRKLSKALSGLNPEGNPHVTLICKRMNVLFPLESSTRDDKAFAYNPRTCNSVRNNLNQPIEKHPFGLDLSFH